MSGRAIGTDEGLGLSDLALMALAIGGAYVMLRPSNAAAAPLFPGMVDITPINPGFAAGELPGTGTYGGTFADMVDVTPINPGFAAIGTGTGTGTFPDTVDVTPINPGFAAIGAGAGTGTGTYGTGTYGAAGAAWGTGTGTGTGTAPGTWGGDTGAAVGDLGTGRATHVSPDGLAYIAREEGFSATPYPDGTGQAIGYGHFILPGEAIPIPLSQDQAFAILAADVGAVAAAIGRSVAVPLSQNQFNALACFVFNIGIPAFRSSTLLRLLNLGDYGGAAAQFGVWNLSGGKISAGLTARRARERELFLAG